MLRRRSGTRRLSMAKRHCKFIISSIFRFFLSGKIRNDSFFRGADCMSSMLWHTMVSKHRHACNGYPHIHHFYFRWSGTRNKVTSKTQWHRWLLALERNCGTRCLPMANRHKSQHTTTSSSTRSRFNSKTKQHTDETTTPKSNQT